ncbi:MAG: hypothetical protein MZU95_03090 [Desulfomicrobium escambiense]|nr:hypothetical protein [Desulfomicrobium escambiense]
MGTFLAGWPLPSCAWMVICACDAPSCRRVSGLAKSVTDNPSSDGPDELRRVLLVDRAAGARHHGDRHEECSCLQCARHVRALSWHCRLACARRTTSHACVEDDYVGSPQSAKFTEMNPVTDTVLPFWSWP